MVCRQIFLCGHCEITVSPEVAAFSPFLTACVHVEENRLNLLHPAEEILPGWRQRGSFLPDRERTTVSAENTGRPVRCCFLPNERSRGRIRLELKCCLLSTESLQAA